MDIEKLKKLKDMTKEETEIFSLESEIDIEKITLDRYTNALVRSGFIETCTGGAYFSTLFNDALEQGFNVIRDSDKSKEDKDKLRHDLYLGEIFSSDNKIEGLKQTLAYYKRLVGWAKHDLNMLNDDIKKKIVMDSIEQKDMWSQQFNRNSKIYEALKDG